MTFPSGLGGSRHSAGLLLRVKRPDGHADEFYLAGGLTIGRTPANTVVLPDDLAVDRTHARVEVAVDGAARLCCVEAQGSLTVDGSAVRELPLDEGVRFRIGGTEFECVSGRRVAGADADRAADACPFCETPGVPLAGDGALPCPRCGQPVLLVPAVAGTSGPRLVPAAYGAYRAESYVARGGMGLVLKGRREGGGDPVAIKVLLPGAGLDRPDAARLRREVETMARVQHPNVVALLGWGKAGRFNYLILAWIEGPTLARLIADANRQGDRPYFKTALVWIESICKGVAAVHAVGLVHRDLKPGNILIAPGGVPRVADFGLARPVDGGATAYTTTGYAPGTFGYMAPEQLATPAAVDARADLFALGVTFYEFLTGARPVGAWRHASEVNPTVPKSFDAILGRLLAPRPSDRYGDIEGLLVALRGLDPATDGARGERTGCVATGPEPPPTAVEVACVCTESVAPRGEEITRASEAIPNIPWSALILAALALGGVCAWYAGRVAVAQVWGEDQVPTAAKYCLGSYLVPSLALSVLALQGDVRDGRKKLPTRTVLVAHAFGCLLTFPCALIGGYVGKVGGAVVGVFTAPFGSTWLDDALATSGTGCVIGAAVGVALPWIVFLKMQE
jgi:hypothetical protein